MQTIISDNAIILTGGPGGGKTTVIDRFRAAGYNTVCESGRRIIGHQQATREHKLPWDDRAAFAMEMFEMAISDDEHTRRSQQVTFFDRAIGDVIGYLLLCQLPVADHIWEMARCRRYHKTVFVMPPWKEIYQNDGQRKQDFKEAVATYEIMLTVYAKLEYALIKVPRQTIEKRCVFIIDALADGRP